MISEVVLLSVVLSGLYIEPTGPKQSFKLPTPRELTKLPTPRDLNEHIRTELIKTYQELLRSTRKAIKTLEMGNRADDKIWIFLLRNQEMQYQKRLDQLEPDSYPPIKMSAFPRANKKVP